MTTPELHWNSPAWLESAHAWIRTVAAGQGLTLTGPIVQFHQRPWSLVLRAPTEAGDWYFKAAAPLLAYEVALTDALARWVSESVLPVLAADLERGWMLLPDGGLRLREVLQKDQDMGHWERLLPVYARAQIALSRHVPELLAFGVPDRRLSALPSLYERLLADVPALGVVSGERLAPAEMRQLEAYIPRVEELCARLAAYPIPASLHHGDLHDGNIFLQESTTFLKESTTFLKEDDRLLQNGVPRFFDWGDASLSHPFVSLRTVFVSVEYTFDLPEDSTLDYPFRDAYLEPWLEFAPYPDLLDAFRLALRLSSLVSALSWHQGLAPLPDAERSEQALAVHLLLREFLERERASA